MTRPRTTPAEPAYLWMAGLAGFILAVAVIAVLREIEHRRGSSG